MRWEAEVGVVIRPPKPGAAIWQDVVAWQKKRTNSPQKGDLEAYRTIEPGTDPGMTDANDICIKYMQPTSCSPRARGDIN